MKLALAIALAPSLAWADASTANLAGPDQPGWVKSCKTALEGAVKGGIRKPFVTVIRDRVELYVPDTAAYAVVAIDEMGRSLITPWRSYQGGPGPGSQSRFRLHHGYVASVGAPDLKQSAALEHAVDQCLEKAK